MVSNTHGSVLAVKPGTHDDGIAVQLVKYLLEDRGFHLSRDPHREISAIAGKIGVPTGKLQGLMGPIVAELRSRAIPLCEAAA